MRDNLIYVLGISQGIRNPNIKNIFAYILLNKPFSYTLLTDRYIGMSCGFSWETVQLYLIDTSYDTSKSFYFIKGCLEPNKNKDNILTLRENPTVGTRFLCFESKKKLVHTLKQLPTLLYETTRDASYLSPRSIEKYQSFINNIQETQEDEEFKKFIKYNHYENLI